MLKSRIVLVWAIVATIVAIVGASTVAAQASSGEGTIYAAYQKVNGMMRFITSPADARPSEEVISWNQVGPQGPQGPQGVPGPTGPQGPSGLSGFEVIYSEGFAVPPHGYKTIHLTAPEGKIIISAGFEANAPNIQVFISAPSHDGRAWTIVAHNSDSSLNGIIRGYAIRVDAPAP